MNMQDDGLADILHEVITSTPGINRVILADKTGLTLAHTARFDLSDVDVDGLGAISSAVYLASETQGQNVGLEEMSGVIAEFKNGKIMVASTSSAVLCLFTDRDVAIGMIRMIIKEAAKKIKSILDARMASEEVVLPANISVDFETGEEKAAASEGPSKDDAELLSDLESALKELEFF